MQTRKAESPAQLGKSSAEITNIPEGEVPRKADEQNNRHWQRQTWNTLDTERPSPMYCGSLRTGVAWLRCSALRREFLARIQVAP